MNGSVKSVTTTPARTGISAASDLPEELDQRRQLEAVVERADDRDHDGAAEDRAGDRVVGQLDDGGQHDPGEDRDAAQERHRAVGETALAGLVDDAGAQGELLDHRGQGRRAGERDEERYERVELVEHWALMVAAGCGRRRCVGRQASGVRRQASDRCAGREVRVQRVAVRDRSRSLCEVVLLVLEVGAERGGDDLADLVEVVDLEAAGRQGGSADPQAAADRRRPGVERHRVAVDRDADLGEAVLGLLAVELGVAQVDEHEVHVGAGREDVDAVAGADQRAATARAPASVRSWRSRKASVWAMRSATALPAITCSSGPPCVPGKTAESIFFLCSSRQMSIPPRAPPSVLWIVVETTSACGTGLGCSPAATRPAKWAMSTSR